jgi:macrolide-specific efflux system membrane fusion protein
MTGKTRNAIIIIILAISAAVFIATRKDDKKSAGETNNEIMPSKGSITNYISTTGTVQPINRLEIKPAVNGRIEKVLVVEGQKVRKGQILIWMSSTERAALIDAARMQGPEAVQYWEDAYKPIPLISPINGMIIVRAKEPGQTITTADAPLVISDKLIIKGDVDETDIGRVKIGQKTMISLDAHPDVTAEGNVTHISYESKTVNNVTTYEVDFTLIKVPAVFRSGMSANIRIIEKKKSDILILPVDAIRMDNQKTFVVVKGSEKKTEERTITTGITDDTNIEIVSGLSENDRVIVSMKKYTPAEKKQTGTSPLQPARRR